MRSLSIYLLFHLESEMSLLYLPTEVQLSSAGWTASVKFSDNAKTEENM